VKTESFRKKVLHRKRNIFLRLFAIAFLVILIPTFVFIYPHGPVSDEVETTSINVHNVNPDGKLPWLADTFQLDIEHRYFGVIKVPAGAARQLVLTYDLETDPPIRGIEVVHQASYEVEEPLPPNRVKFGSIANGSGAVISGLSWLGPPGGAGEYEYHENSEGSLEFGGEASVEIMRNPSPPPDEFYFAKEGSVQGSGALKVNWARGKNKYGLDVNLICTENTTGYFSPELDNAYAFFSIGTKMEENQPLIPVNLTYQGLYNVNNKEEYIEGKGLLAGILNQPELGRIIVISVLQMPNGKFILFLWMNEEITFDLTPIPGAPENTTMTVPPADVQAHVEPLDGGTYRETHYELETMVSATVPSMPSGARIGVRSEIIDKNRFKVYASFSAPRGSAWSVADPLVTVRNLKISTEDFPEGVIPNVWVSISAEIQWVVKPKLYIVYDVGGRGDMSFNDMAYMGGKRAEQELGVKLVEMPSATEADYVSNLRTAASDPGAGLIVGVGYLFNNALVEVAKEFPEQDFVGIDTNTKGVEPQPNLLDVVFEEHKGSALVGTLAAMLAYHYEKPYVGAVLGMDIPVLWKFEIGYKWGAEYWAPEWYRQRFGTWPPIVDTLWTYTGTFWDITKGYEAAKPMYEAGAVAVYNIAGSTGLGINEAVKEIAEAENLENGPPFMIGVDADQDWINPGFVIASGMKRVDKGVFYATKLVLEDKFRDAIGEYGNQITLGIGTTVLGMPMEGINISTLEDLDAFLELGIEAGIIGPENRDVIYEKVRSMRENQPAWIWEAVAELEEKIRTGEVEVPMVVTEDERDYWRGIFERLPSVKPRLYIVYDVGGRGDLSFNDMAYMGGKRAEQEFSIELIGMPSMTEADYVPNLRAAAFDPNAELIVGVGFTLTDALVEVALEYPDKNFVGIDTYTKWTDAGGLKEVGEVLPNLMDIVYEEHKGSALVGVLGGLLAAYYDKPHIGVVLGMEIPVIWKFEIGYKWGCDWAMSWYENNFPDNYAVEPDNSIVKTPKKERVLYMYTGTWDNITKGYEAAKPMYEMGAVAVYNIAGKTGLGINEAIREIAEAENLENGPPFMIGVDASQDWINPGFVIASMMKRIDYSVYYATELVLENKFRDAVQEYDGAIKLGIGTEVLGIPMEGISVSTLDDLDALLELGIEEGIIDPENRDAIYEKVRAMREAQPSWIWEAVGELENKIRTGVENVPEADTEEEIIYWRSIFG